MGFEVEGHGVETWKLMVISQKTADSKVKCNTLDFSG
jgi:hypothetical protein